MIISLMVIMCLDVVQAQTVTMSDAITTARSQSVEALKARQSFMESKGLVRDLDVDDAQEILKRATTLAYDLGHMSEKSADLSKVKSIEDLAYFTQVVQESMGVISKTSTEFENDRPYDHSLSA